MIVLLVLLAAPAVASAFWPWSGGGDGFDPERLHVVLVNGGGKKVINYRSHLEHVRSFTRLLTERGIPEKNVMIFSADGSDPAADVATRELDEKDSWLLPRSLGHPPIEFVSSEVKGFTLRAASKKALAGWFRKEGARLRPGDRLLFYVTDHGADDPKDPLGNTISLWGEDLTVRELRKLFATLDPQVRVTMLMSQCFSGGFAHAIYPTDDAELPGGNVCGYFASTEDREAYGCYPENRGKDGVGHSYEMFQALERLGNLPEAERRILVSDGTPDVPHTTSEFFLEELLAEEADAAGQELPRFVDRLLAEAWRDRARLEPEIRLIDRIGQAFGFFSPRSLAELDVQSRELPKLTDELDVYADRWDDALDALVEENFQRFLKARPDWRDHAKLPNTGPIDPKARRSLVRSVLTDLLPFTAGDSVTNERLLSLRGKADDAEAASYRNEVRLAAVLRLRALLTAIAGRTYVSRRGTPEQRVALERLEQCENLVLDPKPPVASATELEPPKPFPPLADEKRIVQSVMPGWMGIRYRAAREGAPATSKKPAGAATVLTVFDDSPAAKAGFEVGDVILGPPGESFEEEHQVREWTMRREVGVPSPLRVLRHGKMVALTLVPGAFPVEMPELPGPPEVGSAAPPVDVKLYRGGRQLAAAKPKLLFFWATWCVICKQALPELDAYAARHPDVDVVAITDEEPDLLRPFFDDFSAPFPRLVAMDPLRKTFQSYGVSGTPTFVLVDGKGIVRYYETGYRREKGLAIDGWKWSANEPPPRRGSS